ncbi:oligopeptide transport system ATP-binding protein [Herbinix hemicellulosilytica]|uniref:Oligopeptide transport ATP-binding protein OppD n=1 Tax=Herbinix hemicellulosilytica TaxID=1564487 RepID=A0A0H5SK31_HERHM|nr:ABC transporter ATP-binding protein [Herbinix hemicellulosilytica]RBP56455.1 oligopeptide transport system ATP-binding protein [Herbinix hemicellulosilytica]CRZ35131.1 Oligopeptide transport ATP-binding protein OppD [Herbinix hemicellulosilytica]
MNKILEVRDLHVTFHTYAGQVKAVRGVSFDLYEGEILAIVGESGSGKSVTAQTIMKLNPMPPTQIERGKILLGDKDIVKASEKEMMAIRGKDISMIFQDPMTSLNPTMTIGRQLTEAIKHHKKLSKDEAQKEAIRLLKLVRIPNPESRIFQYPHEFSGGMRQRVMIAMALSCQPKLLIADEPTTALDVTIQAQIIDILKEIREKTGTSIIIITHDLGVVANMADRVAVMYGGKIVETGSVDDIFYRPAHPYTKALLESLPKTDTDKNTRLVSIEGTPPDLLNPPVGCPFAGRCKYTMKICKTQMPPHFEPSKDHKSACWLLHEDCPYSDFKNPDGGGENDE